MDPLQLQTPHPERQGARQPTISHSAAPMFGSTDEGHACRSAAQQQHAQAELQHWQPSFPSSMHAVAANGSLRLQSPEGLLAHAHQVRTCCGA